MKFLTFVELAFFQPMLDLIGLILQTVHGRTWIIFGSLFLWDFQFYFVWGKLCSTGSLRTGPLIMNDSCYFLAKTSCARFILSICAFRLPDVDIWAWSPRVHWPVLYCTEVLKYSFCECFQGCSAYYLAYCWGYF